MTATFAVPRGGPNHSASHRCRRRRDTGRRAGRIRLDGGWHDRLLEPRIAPATLTLASGVLRYTAASGESNRLAVDVVQVSGTNYLRFNEQGAGLAIKAQGTGLIVVSTTVVRAPAASVKSIVIDTKDKADTVSLALGAGFLAAVSVNVDPAPNADGSVTIPPYALDQLTIRGPNGGDTLALSPQLAPDGTKDILLGDKLTGSKIALQHMGNLTIDLSQSTGGHSVTVDRSITRPDAPIALKVIGGPSGGDSLTVTAPGTIPQTFTLTDGSIKTSEARTGKEIVLGPDDNIAIDQPQVAVELLTKDASGNPVSLGPSTFNSFLLDTGSSSILAAADATADLESSGLYRVYPIQYLEQGVGGYAAMDVSYPYRFDFAGTNGIRQVLNNVKILSSENLQFSFLGPDGIVGMPAMVNRFTTIDMSGWEDPQSLDDLNIKVDFPTGSNVPASSAHWYKVPVKLVNFPNDGQLPGGPTPTSAPLAMIPATIRDNGQEVTSNFLLDTGAQISMISPGVAKSLKLDLSHPSGSIDVGGVGGTVSVPLVPVDRLAVKAQSGTSLVWTDLQVGVLDLSVPGGPTIGGVFGMDFLTSGWAAKVLPILLGQPGSSRNGYFDHIYLDYRNSSTGTGTVIFDVDPSHDTPGPPNPNTLSVSYSHLGRVNATGGNGSDAFNVTPSPIITYTLDGGGQPGGGGDALKLVPDGLQAVNNGSRITVPGDKWIDYLNMEKVILGSAGKTISPTTVNFSKVALRSYGGSQYDVAGTATVQDSGATLHLVGNLSKAIPFSYYVTPNTVLEFDFKSGSQGGIHSIGMDTTTATRTAWRNFELYGTQSYGQTAYRNYASAAPGWKHYVIPIGKYFTGDMNFMTFITSRNALHPTAESYFSHIKVYEKSGVQSLSSTTVVVAPTGTIGAMPLIIVTPQTLGATLRTAVLDAPGNRFARMLNSIAALWGRRPEALRLSPRLAAAASERPGGERPDEARGWIAAAPARDSVRDEALSQIMALDPIFRKPKSKGPFS